MADASNEEDNIPWSGFIDILSSVIMVFIFFVLLTVIVISQSTKKTKIVDNRNSQSDEIINYTANRTEKTIIQTALIDEVKNQFYVLYGDTGITLLEEVHQQIGTYFGFEPKSNVSKEQDTPKEDNKTETKELSAEDKLTESKEIPKIDSQPKVAKICDKNKIIFIESYAPLYLDTSQKQEIALYRAFNVRNYLLQSGISQQNIKIKIYTQAQENKDLHEECISNILGCVLIR